MIKQNDALLLMIRPRAPSPTPVLRPLGKVSKVTEGRVLSYVD